MLKKYRNLLSPIKVGNVVFRNRLVVPPSSPYLLQGSEPYPTEATAIHYASKAKNGAALVTLTRTPHEVPVRAEKHFLFGGHGSTKHRVATEGKPEGPFAHNIESHFAQAVEAIHFYGSKASIWINTDVPPEYDVSAGFPLMVPDSEGILSKEIPGELLGKIADAYALQAAFMKDQGFDMVTLHMSYRMTLAGRFLSPLTNQRTDRYGGTLENRARFPLMIADRIKQKCGQGFLIEATISGCEDFPGGLTLEDTIAYARLFAGHLDLLQIRAGEIDQAHPTGFNPERTPFLHMAETIKKSGAEIAIVTVGGYQDLDICEEIIASGKADFIGMARAWVSNPDYGRKAYEGRNDDIVPCLRCNGCHIHSWAAPFTSVCAVNPAWGLEHKLDRMVEPATEIKKVAVVGGGIAGMEAALVAAGRGHQVTLYEKSDTLGGLLKTADNVSFKWPQKDFKDYLIRQIEKSSVRVLLNTAATPGMLKKEKYDAVIAAVGSEPVVPDIPGIDGRNVVFAADVYGAEDKMAENVVVIGGGEVGVETGMHLAEKGHEVTVLEMGDMLAPASVPIHFYTMFRDAWEKLQNFSYILEARCTAIGAGGVTYFDANGLEHTIKAGSVVIAAGMKPKSALAMEFYDAGGRFYLVGDCDITGNVQKAMRSAFGIASTL